MKAGWTGAQYSIYRVGLSLLVAFSIAGLIATPQPENTTALWTALPWLGVPATLALALGLRDRWAAALLIPILALGIVATVRAGAGGHAPFDGIFAIVLLAFHVAVPGAPFGSFDARGRTDPGGTWTRPIWIGHAAWSLLAFLYLASGLARVAVISSISTGVGMIAISWLGLVFEVGFAIGTFRSRWRPALWLAMAFWRIAWITAFGPHPGDASLALLQILACEPSTWWPGRSAHSPSPGAIAAGPARLFYDGDCGLCHRSVRFILSEERGTPEALRLRFAPLESRTFEQRLATRGDLSIDSLPDSIVVELEDGSILVRSAAACEIASRLGGLWLGLARASAWLPRRLLDRGYDGIAFIRKHLFARPAESCPILPPALRARFDP